MFDRARQHKPLETSHCNPVYLQDRRCGIGGGGDAWLCASHLVLGAVSHQTAQPSGLQKKMFIIARDINQVLGAWWW